MSDFSHINGLKRSIESGIKNPGNPILFTGIFLVTCGVYLFLSKHPFNHDTSWYFTGVNIWRGGGELYVDVIEVNPPLFFYIVGFALFVGEIFSLTNRHGMYLFLFILTIFSFSSVFYLCTKLFSNKIHIYSIIIASIIGILFLPIHYFGQREHVLVILVIPYILNHARVVTVNSVSFPERVFWAIIALPGLLLKPHFFTLPLFLTIFEIFRVRSFKPIFIPENFTFLAGGMLYALFVAYQHPEYYTSIIPKAQLAYGAYGVSAREVIIKPSLLASMFVVLISVFCCRNDYCRVSQVLLWSMLAFCVSYLTQFKGYDYQTLPLQTTALIAVVWYLVKPKSSLPNSKLRVSSLALHLSLSSIVVFLLTAPVMIQGPYRYAGSIKTVEKTTALRSYGSSIFASIDKCISLIPIGS